MNNNMKHYFKKAKDILKGTIEILVLLKKVFYLLKMFFQ